MVPLLLMSWALHTPAGRAACLLIQTRCLSVLTPKIDNLLSLWRSNEYGDGGPQVALWSYFCIQR